MLRHLDRDFHGDGRGVGGEHEALDGVVTESVVGRGLKREACHTQGEVASFFDLDAGQIKGCAGGGRTAVFLEEMVWAVGGHLGEVRFNWREGCVFAIGQEVVEFAAMGAEHIDLFVMQPRGADELVWSEVRSDMRPECGVGREVAVLGEPCRQGTGAHGKAEPFLETCGGFRGGVPLVIEGQGFKDDLEGVGLALGDLWGEDSLAVGAVPELHGLVLFVALPFFGDGRASTVDAAFEISADELCSPAGFAGCSA